MMSLPLLNELFDYNYWARDRQLQACAALTEEQFLRPLGNSFPSLRDTFTHLLAVASLVVAVLVFLVNNGIELVIAQASSNGNWLAVSPGTGTAPGSLVCPPSTATLLVPATSLSSGAYNLNYASSRDYDATRSWEGNGTATAAPGSIVLFGIAGYAQFAIDATPVPEPRSLALLGLGGVAGLFFVRRKV